MEKQKNRRTDLILHGHFYQPPRENPLVDIIPKQASAKPYTDWNERIFDDCYRANAYSRYLDSYGHIQEIVNNYEYISFNFGPTLLKWIAFHHPETYKRILTADQSSLERLGHGNAIAQAYNHTILPLATQADMRTQILWGIDDFKLRFNRDPEGMWMPETAINQYVIDVLTDAGIKFVILSPWQCKAIETTSDSYKLMHGNDVPYGEPFTIEGAQGGSIAAFFYHPDLASSISFGHMLRDADAMYRSLLEIKKHDRQPLLHTATDGEIYGHHEAFGDMALAALIRKVHEGDAFEFTNYATYLANHPPRYQAILHEGEEGKGTSWSCSHGVSRWYKDCGCHTGGEAGWNQSWRTPLREAFDLLATAVDSLYDQEMKKIFKDSINPQTILNAYSAVIGDFIDIEEFITRWEKQANCTIHDRRAFAELLEGQRFKHYTYTSCGWFFSDLSGIEPKQNIHYAIRVIGLYQRFTDQDLLELILPTLHLAKSNKRSEGSGRTIAKSFVTGIGGEAEAGAYFLMNQNFAKREDLVTSYGKYRMIAFNSVGDNVFAIELLDVKTLRHDSLQLQVESTTKNGYSVSMHILDHELKKTINHTFSTAQIPPRMLEEVYSWINHALSQITDEEFQRIATNIRHYSLLVKNTRSAPSDTLYIENMGTCLRALRSLFTTPDTIPWEQKQESISHLLAFINRRGHQNEQLIVRNIFSQEVERVATNIHTAGFSYEKGSYLLAVLKVARDNGIQPSITLAQEILYPHIMGDLRRLYITPLTHNVIENLSKALNFSIQKKPLILEHKH